MYLFLALLHIVISFVDVFIAHVKQTLLHVPVLHLLLLLHVPVIYRTFSAAT